MVIEQNEAVFALVKFTFWSNTSGYEITQNLLYELALVNLSAVQFWCLNLTKLPVHNFNHVFISLMTMKVTLLLLQMTTKVTLLRRVGSENT